MKRLWISTALVLGLVDCGGSTNTDPGGGGSGGSGGGGGSNELTSCVVNSDCVLRAESCCGACGTATREDSIAINVQHAAEYAERVCKNQGCDDCVMPQDATLLATCRAGHCAVVDLMQHPSTECQSDADCRVRTNECCECGGAVDIEHLVSIASSGAGSFADLVCDPSHGCPECEPEYPAVPVNCVQGRCRVGGPL